MGARRAHVYFMAGATKGANCCECRALLSVRNEDCLAQLSCFLIARFAQ